LAEFGNGASGNDYFVDVADAERVPGGLVVLDRSLKTLVLYGELDPVTGISIGGPGDGPGEFGRPETVDYDSSDNTLRVFDARTQRLSVFDRSGELISAERVADFPFPLGRVLVTENGRRFARSPDRVSRAELNALARDTVIYAWLTDDRELQDVPLRLPGIMISSAAVPGSAQMGFRQAPFSPAPKEAVLGECVIVAATDIDALHLLHPDSTAPVAVLRTGREPIPITPSHWDAWKADLFSEIPAADTPEGQRVLDRLARPEHLPVYADLKVDPTGLIWLQRYAPPRGYGPSWDLIAPDGEMVGEIEFPEPMRVFHVGSDFVVTGVVGDMGEQLVRVYELTGPRPHQARPGGCLAG
jgi:hypothetical protein